MIKPLKPLKPWNPPKVFLLDISFTRGKIPRRNEGPPITSPSCMNMQMNCQGPS